MAKLREYRIVFYFDKRYNKDRYIIVGGTYKDAVASINELKSKDFVDNVSRYWVIDDMYLIKDGNQRMVIKSYLTDAMTRQYWEDKNIYHL